MALKSFKREREKAHRIATQWSKVDDRVFTKLGVSRAELERLEMQLRGKIVVPGDPDYDKDRQGNPLYPEYPQMIVYCDVYEDVRWALDMAQTKSLWVTTRSGGHSTAGYSVNSGMVIDVSHLDCVDVDPVQQQAHVGAGANWGAINSMLNTYQLHVPGGGCADVGVAGFVQGGGYGFTSREFGMNCDSVLQCRFMLADGGIVVANTQTNPDLLWAACGGTGNNFGVLLDVTYQLYRLYKLWGFGIWWSLDDAPAALVQLQTNYMKTGAPPQLGYQAVLGTLSTMNNRPALVMLGMYDGTLAALNTLIQPLLATNGQLLTGYPAQGTYEHLNDSLLNALNPPTDDCIEFKRSGYIAQPLQLSDWQAIVSYFETSPNLYNLMGIEAYGGAINGYHGNNAFMHRNVYADVFVDSFFDTAGKITPRTTAQAWIDGFMQVLAPHYNGQVYQNYPVRDFPDFRSAYWGDAFNSLLYVKTKYDPGNFFRFEQSISPYPYDPRITRSTKPSRFADPEIVYEVPPRASRWAPMTAGRAPGNVPLIAPER